MTMIDLQISERAAALRQAFDRSFAEPPRIEKAATEDFLAIHVAGDPYLLRLASIAGVHADKRVTGLPSRAPDLRGVAGFRGAIVPVYDLAALLRYPRAESPRWIAIAAEAQVALAFDSFDGHFRFPREAVASQADAVSREHVHEILRSGDAVRSIIHLPSVIAAIRKQVPETASKKEH